VVLLPAALPVVIAVVVLQVVPLTWLPVAALQVLLLTNKIRVKQSAVSLLHRVAELPQPNGTTYTRTNTVDGVRT